MWKSDMAACATVIVTRVVREDDEAIAVFTNKV
jgi:hypothetical protein